MTHPVIPPAALEQHIAVLGKTGAGKTTLSKSAIVEPLLAAGKHVGVVDPTGAWWGLRSARDGKKPGFKVLVLGGDHGDIPLAPSSGAAVARLLVEQGINLVADTSLMTVGERTRWFTDFAGTLNRVNRAPLYLVLDEAHNFAPQGKVPDPETGKMLHATNSLASGGRSRGIRLTMLTQRPQKLHKDTLTSADTLIAMRVLAPQDRGAIKDWMDGCADAKAGKQVLDSLAGLPRGTGWVWYPEGSFLECIAFPPATTFDSSAAPKEGDGPAPKAANIDLTEINAALAEAMKEAAANDPKQLRARIAELEKQVGKPAAPAAPDPAVLEREYWRGVSIGKKHALESVMEHAANVALATEALHLACKDVPDAALDTKVRALAKQIEALPTPRAPAKTAPAPRPAAAGTGTMSKAERAILTALAQYKEAGRSKNQVAVLTGYSHNGGGFNNSLSSLRSKGWAAGGGDRMQITAAGLEALGP
jgi:hypothetical protein